MGKFYNGLSVLPYNGGTYIQAPFEDIDKEKYEEMLKTLIDIDLSKVVELDDNTDHANEVACGGGQCEIDVDLKSLSTDIKEMETSETQT